MLLNRMNPFRPKNGRIPSLSDIQSRIAYVSSVKQLSDVKKQSGCLYLHPPIQDFAIMEFGKFVEIEQCGYVYGKKIIEEWRQSGVLRDIFRINDAPEMYNRRASI